MSKLTEKETALINDYHNLNEEERKNRHEKLDYPFIDEHSKNFEVPNLSFYGILFEDATRSYLVKERQNLSSLYLK